MSFTKQCVEDSYYKATNVQIYKSVWTQCSLYKSQSTWKYACMVLPHIPPSKCPHSTYMVNTEHLMNIELSCWPMGFYGESWNQAMRRSANFLTPTLSSLLVRWRWGMTDCLVATAVISLIKVLLLVWVRSDLKGGGLCNTGLSFSTKIQDHSSKESIWADGSWDRKDL